MLTVLLIVTIALLAHELGSRRGNKQILIGLIAFVVAALVWHKAGDQILARAQSVHLPDFGSPSTWPMRPGATTHG